MTTVDARILALAQTIWEYHRLHHTVAPADAILVLCSHDVRVADRGAELLLEGRAPLLIFSGGSGAVTRQLWDEPEADRFARQAVALGVHPDRILVENQSTNTGENVRFTRALLADRGLDPSRFLVVQKPYMERRSYATFRKVWPEKEVIVTSPQVGSEEYLRDYSHDSLGPAAVIEIMVGDLQRIRVYPDRGFQISQDIPAHVWSAYEALVEAGFDGRLI